MPTSPRAEMRILSTLLVIVFKAKPFLVPRVVSFVTVFPPITQPCAVAGCKLQRVRAAAAAAITSIDFFFIHEDLIVYESVYIAYSFLRVFGRSLFFRKAFKGSVH